MEKGKGETKGGREREYREGRLRNGYGAGRPMLIILT